MNTVLRNILRFVILILAQVLFVNNLQVLSFCNPQIYIYFLMLLPVALPREWELLIAFGCGLVMDVFSDSLGMHAAVCTLVGYLRPLLIAALVSDHERINGEPGIKTFGMVTFVKYLCILTLIHHTSIFLLEIFSFAHLPWLMLRIIVSSLVTIAVLLSIELLRQRS